jgi:integrase
MRGHIRQRSKGKDSYTIIISLGKDPATGKRLQHWEAVKGTKRDAERRLAELLHELDTGTFTKPGKVTVRDFLERWLTDYAKPLCETTSYRTSANFPCPNYGRPTYSSTTQLG